ncbi:hypothetical protein BDBG_16994 [Blastomyces gilchristii SLH14081]|uniref:Uncharacterized protein n=1 Tax=Blastomyces gilchristii (strain SLH14081) TaxID=559298 RepID=A0A179UKB4_BLAGS|nr:uncharacterized protein BDBG_16994 [Blastomyces gilchristii SLH14081]OAT08330.1 hypothetical protein BDBG_16994 [Blastomyces gilchristii SLH14081]
MQSGSIYPPRTKQSNTLASPTQVSLNGSISAISVFRNVVYGGSISTQGDKCQADEGMMERRGRRGRASACGDLKVIRNFVCFKLNKERATFYIYYSFPGSFFVYLIMHAGNS